MSRRTRLVVFAVAAAVVAVLFALAVAGLPSFGGDMHPYRDRAVAAAVAHVTPNVVSAVNYDQRAFDTFGEETILLGAVVGAASLLRKSSDESEMSDAGESGIDSEPGGVLGATALLGYLLLPVTLLIGVDVVAHGHLTPGGGFQGGVVLGTGIHLLYLTGRYRALERVRPMDVFAGGEALGTAAFAALAIAGLVAGGSFLANVLPFGRFGALFSSGTVPLLSVAIGIEVGSGVIVLLAGFLHQALRMRRTGDRS
jgi:multicomponent Na+:H+ antiporter subunit B